jgi:hypothetical protein
MPNHVINEVTLHGVSLARAAPLVLDRDGNLSFAVLLPLPLNFWASSSSRMHEEAFPGTWLDAARQTWGTKWDAYGSPVAEEIEGSAALTFKSAWNHPRGWTCALFNSLRCEITAKWLSEGGSPATVETYRPDAGPMGDEWRSENIPEGSSEHGRLHKLLWGVEEFGEADE